MCFSHGERSWLRHEYCKNTFHHCNYVVRNLLPKFPPHAFQLGSSMALEPGCATCQTWHNAQKKSSLPILGLQKYFAFRLITTEQSLLEELRRAGKLHLFFYSEAENDNLAAVYIHNTYIRWLLINVDHLGIFNMRSLYSNLRSCTCTRNSPLVNAVYDYYIELLRWF